MAYEVRRRLSEMGSIICTLFEEDYHYGLAAMVNSLNCQGFKGSIYAGYRGALPPWVNQGILKEDLNWPGAETLILTEQLKLHFLPLDTNYHLTNYKPNFLLKVLEISPEEPSKIFYFDPDIILVSRWSFFENWLDSCDVGFFEDINSPLSENHIRRIAWRKYFESYQISLNFKDPTYVNGGFIGVNTDKRCFLELWKKLQELMAPAIGGLNRSSISGAPIHGDAPCDPFAKSDQDALNATIEAWNGRISFIGKEGMAFEPGEAIIPHALGQPKPWQIKPVLHAFAGFRPRKVDKVYWQHSNGIVSTQSSAKVTYTLFEQKIASFIGRFYGRY